MKLLNQDIIDKSIELIKFYEQSTLDNRVFKNIDKKVFKDSLDVLIITNGEALYQSKNTCGIASVLYLISQNDLQKVIEFAIDLFYTGEGSLNNYHIVEKDNIKKWAGNIKPVNEFDGISLVLIGAIRFKENSSLRFVNNTMDGMTWPFEISKVLSKMSTLKVESSLLLGWNLNKLKKKLEKGHQIILLYRTSSWKEISNVFKDSWHYIVLKEIKIIQRNEVLLRYWDYGTVKSKKITKSQFYRGVVKTFVLSGY